MENERDLGKEEILVDYLEPGMILVGPLFDYSGRYLWPAMQPLTPALINRLKNEGIEKVYYSKPNTKKDIKYSNPMISEKILEEAIEILSEIISAVENNKKPDIEKTKKVVEKIFQEIVKKFESAVLNLLMIKNYDDYTYTHSINVSAISMFFAKTLKLSDYVVKEIGLGGLLHDLGKVKIPKEILNKPDKLTEKEFIEMKKHPIYGYFIIKDDSNISTYVKKIVLFHHERYDGKGYPLGLTFERVGRYPQIVGLADVYDALTTERPYKRPYSINETLEYIMENSGTAFEPILAQKFINEMAKMYNIGSFYPIGGFVLLNTGEKGIIIDKDTEYTLRPKIKILTDPKGGIARSKQVIDLKTDPNRYIIKIISDKLEIERLSILLD